MLRKAMGMTIFAVIFLLAGYMLGVQGAQSALASPQTTDAAQRDKLFAPFWETWDMLHDVYVDIDEVDDIALMEGALEGMLSVLGDPNTTYMTPAEFAMANEDLEGKFEGIGAYVRKDEITGALIIVSVIETSPAEAAGVLDGDAVYEVDGENITDLDQAQLINRVRGPAGTTVTLGIRRHGVSGILQIDVVRASIKIPSVEGEMVDDGTVAYLRLRQFGAQTEAEMTAILEDLMAQEPSGLVLDLRGNPGGYLNTAVNIASEFIPEGVVLIERSATDEQEHVATQDGVAEDVPMVVLVDQGSASASELLAGALQDTERAVVIGTDTFGKGTVQTWRMLSNGGGVRVTIARWYTPEGHTVDGTGLAPDMKLNWPTYAIYEGFDPTLEAALRVLDGQSVWQTWPFPLPLDLPHPLH